LRPHQGDHPVNQFHHRKYILDLSLPHLHDISFVQRASTPIRLRLLNQIIVELRI
jgi:hypothetical protein